jgi:hypothetical protein
MTFNKEVYWFFAWSKRAGYITSIIGLSRNHCIEQAVKYQGLTWKQLYNRGGRCIKCVVAPMIEEKP